MLETGQRLVLALQGEAYAPRLVPSNTALDFGECGQYERVELPLTLTNQAPLPVSVSFGRTANFTASPTSLTVPASGTAKLAVTFEPHQLGPLKGTIQMSFFDGKVSVTPLHMNGTCVLPARRVPAGGGAAGFEVPSALSHDTAASALPGPSEGSGRSHAPQSNA